MILEEIIRKQKLEIERLEKENKKLKEKLNIKEVYSSYLPEDTECIIMTKEDYERQELEYRTRIDKAIYFLELDMYGTALDILKGEDKE